MRNSNAVLNFVGFSSRRGYIYIYKSDPRVHIRAYSYSLADVLDGRPFRVVPSLRRIFQQLDARRTVRQVYPGCRVVSNEPRRASPTASFPHYRLLFRVTSLETVCIRIHLLLLLTPCVVIRSFSPRIRGTTTRSLPQERVTRFLVRYRLWGGGGRIERCNLEATHRINGLYSPRGRGETLVRLSGGKSC